MIELVLVPIVFLDVIFALICVGAFPQSLLKNLHGKLVSVNYSGLLKALVMSVDWQRLPMVQETVRLRSGRQMRLHRIGNRKRNSKVISGVYMEYNGVTGTNIAQKKIWVRRTKVVHASQWTKQKSTNWQISLKD